MKTNTVNILTKLEVFIINHPDLTFEEMATQLNRTPAAIERAYDRAQKKLTKIQHDLTQN